MIETEVIFCCDLCGKTTENPEKDRWFSINNNKNILLCHGCVDRFIHDFDGWLKVLRIRVEIEYLNTKTAVKDGLGIINVKSAAANVEWGGLKQLNWVVNNRA